MPRRRRKEKKPGTPLPEGEFEYRPNPNPARPHSTEGRTYKWTCANCGMWEIAPATLGVNDNEAIQKKALRHRCGEDREDKSRKDIWG